MSTCTVAVLSPVWICIAFNLLLTLFNLVGMAVDLRGAFINWYLEGGGGWWIMGTVWTTTILWSAINGLVYCT